jgi:hypothetical protein
VGRGQKPIKREKTQTDIIQTWKTIEYRRIAGLRLLCKRMILFLENDVIFIGNDVSDWSISFVTTYLIGQSFCFSIGQLFMQWSFLIGSFSSILIGGCKMTSYYKRYATPCMIPTGTNRTKKGLYMKVQEVCKADFALGRWFPPPRYN